MRAFTSIEQSKKLAEILPIESADMAYMAIIEDYIYPQKVKEYRLTIKDECFNLKYDIPAWSLAALLEQLEDTAGLAKDYGLWFCYDNRKSYCTKHYDNPVDACYEMIEKLKEKG